MINRRVILFTRRFPYFKTEAFLESEIESLAKGFSEVIIIPSEIGEEIRPIPKSVKVDTGFSKIYQNKIYRSFMTVFSKFFWNTLWNYRNQITDKATLIHLFQFSSSVVSYNKFLKTYVFKEDDLLYSYWFSGATKSLVDLKENLNVKVVARAHRYDIYEGLSTTPKFWPYRKEILKKIDCVYSISEDGKDYLENKYGIVNKIKVSKLGVFDRQVLAQDPILDEILIVSVSRVDPMKRVDLIAKCISRFATENLEKNVNWYHFGDGKILNDIKREILNTSNLICHLNGAVPNREVYTFYSNSPVSLFINLSSSEGIPVSIMEAQSFGIPVVATNVGGSGEIVNDKTGKLLSSNPSEAEVVYAIHEVLERKIPRVEIKNIWNSNFNAEINYQNFIEDLKSI